ncbi:glycosyltransferase [Microbacterium sp. NPDC091313]
MIGWYVHHHGHGHLTRFLAVRPHVAGAVTVFSSLPAPAGLDADTAWVRLPADDDPYLRDGAVRHPRAARPTAGGALHWAPLGHPGHRARLVAIADAVERMDPAGFVVDVSVEVATLVRLLGVPTIVVTQPGERTDAPHRLAYRLADRVLAPWAEGLIPAPDAAGGVRHTGGISRFDARALPAGRDPRRVAFLGRTLPDEELRAATGLLTAAGWHVDAVGTGGAPRDDDPWSRLAAASVVVSAAGQNSVADLAAAGARAVVLPQARPFDEQHATAAVLEQRRLAVVAPPDSWRRLPALVADAAASDPDWSVWRVSGAAARAGAAIAEVAG